MAGLGRQPLSDFDKNMLAQIAQEKAKERVLKTAATTDMNASKSAFAPKVDPLQAAIMEKKKMNAIAGNPIGVAANWLRGR